MDPLSVAASAIAVATLASQICAAFSNLRSLCRNLPGRLHALNNEAADLQIVLLELASLVERRAVLPDSKQSAIPHLLQQANIKLVELQRIVARLRTTCRDAKLPIVAANVLRKEQSKLQTLHEDIRSVRCNLNTLLGASNSQDMMQIRLDLESISVVTTKSSQEQVALQGQLMSSLAIVDERIARVEEMLRMQADQVRENQLQQVDGAQCIRYALNGNIEGLRYLFINGLASPQDISPARGYTLLRWALYGKQYATCEFLIHAGADPDYRPLAASDNSPRIKACHFLLEGGLPDSGVDVLRLITKGGHYDDFIDESRFTQTHRIVLSLSLQSLDEELILHPDDINEQDAMGRTPLAWAAARGDTRAVVTLLSHGADPNVIDVQISGPLSNAPARGYTACVRLLLEAGAHPDPPIPSGIKKGSPLNAAARNATDVVLLKSLLDFGADVDSSGTDGDTALVHAARTDNASFALLFLEYGADINATSATGATPLNTAINYNSHNVLRLILDHWHEYADCPRLKAPHLLQIAALYADVETLQILAGTDHLRMRHDKSYTIGDFSSRLHQRPDITEKLVLAFDELLDAINGVPDPKRSPESLLESGFMPRVSVRVDSDLTLVEDDVDDSSGYLRFFSCPGSRVNSGMPHETFESGDDSDESFEDALEAGLEKLQMGTEDKPGFKGR